MRWRFATPPDPAALREFARTLGVSAPLAAALFARGAGERQTAATLLAPSLAQLVPPEQLPGVVEADARIRRAIAQGEAMVVFGDFDADGVCASVVLTSAIAAAGGRVELFLPDRLAEGYGLSTAAVERALGLHPATRLLITVDCGISQHEGCAACRQAGVEVIVTDHHVLPAVLPETTATINPHLPGTPPALQALAGVGVAFKLAHMLSRQGAGHRFDPAALLPIVALGTVADVAPLTGENRVLVHAGLARLNRNRHLGLAALKRAARLSSDATAMDLAFRLGPRINAAGRIGDPMLAVELLRTDDPQRAADLAKQLEELNTDRQQREKDACDEAFGQLAAELDAATHRAAVVWNANWHPGIVGLVAGRLCHRLRLPAVAFHLGPDGEARGSARCPDVGDVDLMALLATCAPLLLRHGGHRAAAGLSLKAADVPAFAEAFRSACAAALEGQDLRPTLDVDAWVEPSLLNLDFHSEVQRLEPCGVGHAPARWALRNVVLSEPPKPMGSDGKHFRFVFRVESGGALNAVLFNALEDPGVFHKGDRLDIAFATRRNDYWGTPDLQLQLDDLRPAQPDA